MEVYLEYRIDCYGADDGHSFVRVTREGMLRLLLDIRGLERFRLRYGVVSHGDVCLEQ